MLHRWVRAKGPHGRPVDLLTGRDFAGFEDALDDLAEHGFVLRSLTMTVAATESPGSSRRCTARRSARRSS